MKIAIISWGSLITTGTNRGLQITGSFQSGGPIVPVEFSRISQSGDRSGCLTLVLDEIDGVNVLTHFATSAHNNLDSALSNLRTVENIDLTYSVGYVNLIRNTERGWAREHHPVSCNTIKAWARVRGFDAVIWTSLLPNFEHITGVPFSVASAVNYVNTLSPQLKEKTIEYIKESPDDIVTPVKNELNRITVSLGLAPQDDGRPLEPGEGSLMRLYRRFRHH